MEVSFDEIKRNVDLFNKCIFVYSASSFSIDVLLVHLTTNPSEAYHYIFVIGNNSFVSINISYMT